MHPSKLTIPDRALLRPEERPHGIHLPRCARWLSHRRLRHREDPSAPRSPRDRSHRPRAARSWGHCPDVGAALSPGTRWLLRLRHRHWADRFGILCLGKRRAVYECCAGHYSRFMVDRLRAWPSGRCSYLQKRVPVAFILPCSGMWSHETVGFADRVGPDLLL